MGQFLEVTVIGYGQGPYTLPDHKIYISAAHIVAVTPNWVMIYKETPHPTIPNHTSRLADHMEISGTSIEVAVRDEESVRTYNVKESVEDVLRALFYLD